MMTLYQVSEEIGRRLSNMFTRDEHDRRAVFGGAEKFQTDPHWRDNVLFYEYFHGDNGAGLGASHQTGGTGVIARAMHIFATLTSQDFLFAEGKMAAFRTAHRPPPTARARTRRELEIDRATDETRMRRGLSKTFSRIEIRQACLFRV